ncbi:MAG: Hint domain-containing protein [Roseovarius sp.]|nr:Hint domain-containing protein [Roseovarius sp.]
MDWMNAEFAADDAAPHAERSGLLSETRLATELGWRPVEALAEGDLVLTFDGGLRPLRGITRRPLRATGSETRRDFWPLEIAAEVIGNPRALRLMPHQALLVESDLAERLCGDPFALLPAHALRVLAGVEPALPGPDEMIVQLHFAREEIVFGDQGLMFLCPAAHDLLEQATGREAPSGYRLLPDALAQEIVQDVAQGPGRSAVRRGPWRPGPADA